MPFLAPLSLLFGLIAVPILILYMLRLRRREVIVSSTLLWQKLVRDREANAPWQKLKRNLLLFLQLFILTLLVLALARPFIRVPSLVNRSIVVLLDGSASMQATDVVPSRFAAAQGEVDRLIAALGSGHQMTLIQVGQTPRVLAAATTDKRLLYDTVAAAGPEEGGADWGAAFALAAGAAQGFRDAKVIIISDGGVPQGLPPLPAETVYVPVGVSAENLAITALATRETEEGVQLFASVTNVGTRLQSTLLSLEVDGVLFDAREISVPPGETVDLSWNLPSQTAVIGARLSDNPEDYLALDNRAVTVHEAGVNNRTLIVSDGNLFLEQIYAVLPGIEPFKLPAEADFPDPDVDPFDLYVFDGVALPDPLPPADLLVINPQPGDLAGSPISVGEVITGTQQTAAVRLVNSPLLQFVDWGGVNIRQMRQIQAPWAETLVEAAAGPLILAGERDGHRIAILAFDLRDSDLPLQITFPILMANLTNWLSPGRVFDVPNSLQPGDVVSLSPPAGVTGVEITRPDGTVWAAEFGEGGLLFTDTGQSGLYSVAIIDETGVRPAGQFAINLFALEESTIEPAEAVLVGATEIQSGTDDDVGQREFWLWLAAAAVLVLLIEWWIFHQGTRWPALPRTLDVEGALRRLKNRPSKRIDN